MTWLERPPDLRVAFISGPYSARTIFGRLLNIYRAGKVAVKYWELGYSVVCAPMNSALMGELWFHSDKCNYEMFMQGYLTMLRRCDTIVMMRGWQRSPGACREWELAKRLGKVILYE